MWRVLLLCVFICFVSATGTLHVDEITGVTDLPVSIPNLKTDHSVSVWLEIEKFQADFAAGFDLTTVGGVSINTKDGISFSTPGNIDLLATVSGGVTLRAQETNFSAGGYISFWAANEGIIDAKQDIVFKVDPDFDEGTINFNSDFGTHLSAALGMVLSSSEGEVRVLAPQGTVQLRGDNIGISNGDDDDDVFQLKSLDKFIIAADREFDIFSERDIIITGDSKVSFNTKYNDINFESAETFTVYGGSNVILSASAGYYLETLLGDLTLDSDESTSIYARQFRASATTTSLSAGTLIEFDSTGNINFLAVNDVAFPTRHDAFAVANNNLYFTGRTGGEVRFDVNALTATCSNLLVQAADVYNNEIQFEASNLEFITKVADIHARTNFFRAAAPVISITAHGDALIAATGHHFVDPASAYEDGALTFATVLDTLFDATNNLSILSDQAELLFDDSTLIRLTVGGGFTTGSAQFAHYEAKDIIFGAATQMSFYAEDAGLYVQSGKDTTYTLSKDFSLTGTWDSEIIAYNKVDILASAVTSKTLAGKTLVYTDDTVLDAGGKITFNADAVDHQITNVHVGHIFSLTGGSVDFDSETQELSFKIPSGGAIFNAKNSINFNLGYGYLTSIGEDIEITGTTTYSAMTGLFFRAGDELDIDALAGNEHFSSTSVKIESGSLVGLTSTRLIIDTDTQAHFKADNAVVFRSDQDLDFSPTNRGDILVHGGRIDLYGPGLLDLDAKEYTSSSGNGLDIEFNVGSLGSTLETKLGAVSFTSDYFQLEAIVAGLTGVTTTFQSTGANLGVTSTDSDVTLRAFGSNAVFTITANKGAVAYSGAAFIYESNNFDAGLFYQGADITSTATSRTEFAMEGDFRISPGRDLLWNGVNFDLEYNPNQQATPTVINSASTDLATCNGDWRFLTDVYTMSGLAGGLSVSQINNPCGTCNGCSLGNFNIHTNAVGTQSYTASSATFSGTNTLQVSTGRALFETAATGTTLTVNSGTFIDISSKNTDSYLFDESHDFVYAGQSVNVIAATYISLTSTGLKGFALSNQENVRGFEVDLNLGDLSVTSTKDAITFSALKQYIELWTEDYLLLTNKQDLRVFGGQGRIGLTANGNILTAQANSTSGIEFWAPNGDLSVKTDLASISIISAKENYVESLTGEIDFTAGYSFSQLADQLGGVISYNTLLGSLSITADLNITLTAGNSELDANIDIQATRDVLINTLYEQRYITSGPAPEGQLSISLIAEEGAIDISTSADQQVTASGDARFESLTNSLTITSKNDLSLLSVAEVRINSTLSSTVTVSKGDINLLGGGGGGSVDIISDGAQSITGNAGQNIQLRAEDSVQIHAQNGLNGVTQKGSVIFQQTGDYQHTNFHSDGSVLLQALRNDGILLSGLSTRVAALRDVTFDATDSWTVGSTSTDSTSTRPQIEFHAGGDFGIDGIEFDITGGMSWTTNKIGPVTFEANRAIWTTVLDMDFTSNGPVYFKNHGEFNEAVMTVSSVGLLTLNAGDAVILKSNGTNQVTVPNHIALSSSGGLPLDTSFIKASNNWQVQTTTLEMTTGVLESELRDYLIDVNGNIVIQNTVGDGGSLRFASDWYFEEKSIGPTVIQAASTTSIITEAPYSDIVFDSAGDLTLTSGGAFSSESSSTQLDAPHGVTITTTAGDMEFVASDDIVVSSNDTLSFTGVDSFIVQSGFTNTGNGLLSSPVNISSRGDLTVQSQTDMIFQTLGIHDDLRIVADKDLLIQNRVPGKSSDQGDIRIDSPGSGYQKAGEDQFLTAGRDIDLEAVIGDFVAYGDFSMTATANQASVFIEGEDPITFNAYNQLTLASKTTLTFTATDDLLWTQINEEGLGGISIGSDTGRTSITGPRQIILNAESAIQASAPYELWSAVRSINVRTSPFGGDIQYRAASSIAFDVDDFSVGNLDDSLTNTVKIFSAPSSSGTSQITLQAPTLTIDTDNHQISFFGDNWSLENPNTSGSKMTFTGSQTVAIISDGVATDSRYAIEIESDDTQAFTSSDELALNANNGLIFIVASEDLTINAAEDVYVSAGDSVLISTGFTVEPNFQIPFRAGILFQSIAESSYRSNKGSVNFFGEDSSWTIAATLTVRAEGDSFFGSPIGNVQWQGDTVATVSQGAFLQASQQIQVITDTFTMRSRGSTTFYSDDADYTGTTTLNLQGEQGVLFTTPLGAVDMGRDNTFRIPRLFKEAGISGHAYTMAYDGIFPQIPTGDIWRTQEENQYPICVERSFGWDSYTNAFCYCDFNKWRCIDSIPPP